MSEKFKKLIEYFTKLPGIGPRQATRLVLAMLDWPEAEVEEFAKALTDLKTGPVLCEQCFNFADQRQCSICANSKRLKTKIAVVEKVTDLVSMEKAGAYDGVYHVLGSAINPVNGYVPEKLKITELISRLNKLKTIHEPSKIEVILATNPNTYGETTALYLDQELKPLGIKITRLARGLAAGSSVEYADEITIANALKHRK